MSEIDGLKEFYDEISTRLPDAEKLLLAWTSPDAAQDTVDQLFRLFHNIKGTAGAFGLDVIPEIFHIAENLLNVYRETRVKPDDDSVQALLESLDRFKKVLETTIKVGSEPKDRPYRLYADLTDQMVALKARTGKDVKLVADELSEKKEKKSEEAHRIVISEQQSSDLVEIVSDFIQLQNRLNSHFGEDRSQLALRNDVNRFSSKLQGFLLDIRLSPIQPLLLNIQRVANSIAKDLGKKFRMQIVGGDTRLDRRVITLLRDPLVHMIRNSLDHGIESPKKRIQSKKTPEGLITFEAYQVSGQVMLSMTDDGAGISADKVKKKAIEKGLITHEQATQMTDREAVNLIFLPGFSTAAQVSSVSGRGVGMDSVKSAVESIGGLVEIDTAVGKGTKITLVLPPSLAIVRSLAFEVGQQVYAVPQTSIDEVLTYSNAIERNELTVMDDGTKFLHRRKVVIPVLSVSKILEIPSDTDEGIFIIVNHRGKRFAIEVDRIVGPLDFVSQPLPEIFQTVAVISGVNQSDNGEYMSLLDLTALGELINESLGTEAALSQLQGIVSTDTTISERFRSQQKLFFFKSGKLLGIPVQAVWQVVQVEASKIETIGERMFLTFSDKTYPVLKTFEHFGGYKLEEREIYTVILTQRADKFAAIVCEDFFGIHRLPREFEMLVRSPGIQGSVVHDSKTFLVCNVAKVFELEFPDEFVMKVAKSDRLHILIAEDDPFFATTIKDFLVGEGMAVTIAEDGKRAKDILEASLESETDMKQIDYVITDFEMPNISGLELLAWIRQHHHLSLLPVVMCTAVGDDVVRRAAQKLGVEAYAGKMNYEDILKHIRRWRRKLKLGITNDVSSNSANGTNEDAKEIQNENQRILAFEVGGIRYGINIEHLKEISIAPRPTGIAWAPEYLGNIVSFRGRPIPVLDLRELIAGEEEKPTAKQLVANLGKQYFAIWVDRVFSVRRVKKMSHSTGLPRPALPDHISKLVGDMLWEDKECYALLDISKIASFFEAIQIQPDAENTKAIVHSLRSKDNGDDTAQSKKTLAA